MSNAKIPVLLTGPLPQYTVDRLEAEFDLRKLWLAVDKAGFLKDACRDVRAVATRSMNGADAALIEALPKLEIISTFGVGLDAVDFDAARRRGIRITNTPGVLTTDVSDFVIGQIFASARRIAEGDHFVRDGRWPKGNLPNATRVRGKTVGVVGFGNIGQAVAARAEALGLRVRYQGPRRKPGVSYPYHADVADLARHCEFLVLCCPLLPETQGLVNAKVLEALGPKGYVINVARGPVVDTAALVAALREKRIAGAALDVFDDEPNVPPELIGLDNVVLTPHIAGGTDETRNEIGDLMMANLKAHFAGTELLTPAL